MEHSPDRAGSRLHAMTNTQLWKLADKHGQTGRDCGRKPTRKRLISRLMMVDEVVVELGKKVV
jgi:hypothetical protein